MKKARKPNSGKASAHVNGVQLARHIALSPQMISRLVKDGVVAQKPGGGFDLDACRISYIQHLRRRHVSKLSAEDTFRELKNRKLQIEVALLDGRAIELEEVHQYNDMQIAAFRTSLHGLGARLSRDPKERTRIDAVTHEILSTLSANFAKQLAALTTTGKLPDSDNADEDQEIEDDDDEGTTDEPHSRLDAN